MFGQGLAREGALFGICIFDGIMDKMLYSIWIFQIKLLCHLLCLYPDGHRFMADNDPKHTSKAAREFLEE